MQMYQRFMCEVVALTHEMNRFSGDAERGVVPVDARLFNALVRLSSTARGGFNKHLEFATAQEIQRLGTRFSLDEPEPKGEEVIDGESVHEEGQADAA
jgi:hypothetical protein